MVMDNHQDRPASITYANALERLEIVAETHRTYLQDIERLVSRKPILSKDIPNLPERHGLSRSRTAPSIPDRHKRVTFTSTLTRSRSYEQTTVPLRRAVGHRSAKTIFAPHSTPRHDSSAVDGFVLCSSLTKRASPENPVIFRVAGAVKAGRSFETLSDSESSSSDNDDDDSDDEEVDKRHIEPETYPQCVGIAIGSRLPVNKFPEMDAIVTWDDVEEHLEPETGGMRIGKLVRAIQITKPVELRQNRRLAGSDIQKGTLIIYEGQTIQTRHIMTLASLRYAEIPVFEDSRLQNYSTKNNDETSKFDVAILCIGSELLEAADNASKLRSFASLSDRDRLLGRTPNSSGPYLMGAIKRSNLDVNTSYLGIVPDDRFALSEKLKHATKSGNHNVIIATGGVSLDRWGLVREVVENELQGEIVFHRVLIEPGMSVVMAIIRRNLDSPKSSDHKLPNMTVLFGLPGNPVATAATFHFLVLPYLELLRSDLDVIQYNLGDFCLAERGRKFRDMSTQPYSQCTAIFSHPKSRVRKPNDVTVFWLAKRVTKLDSNGDETEIVQILEDQAAYKVGALLEADCWVVVPEGISAVVSRDIMATVDFEPDFRG